MGPSIEPDHFGIVGLYFSVWRGGSFGYLKLSSLQVMSLLVLTSS